MSLTIGDLVGFIRADDSGMRRGLSNAELRMRGFQRDTEGRLRDLRGRFVTEGEAAGMGLGDAIRAAADETGDSLSGLNGVIRGVGLSIGGMSAGAVGAAGILASLPLAVIGLGAAVLAENEQVKSAFSNLGSYVKSQMQELAQPLVKPFVEAAGQLRTIFDEIAPHIGQAFAAVAPMIAPLVDGIGQFVTGLMPGFVKGLESAQPVIEALAGGLGDVGRGLGGFLEGLSSGSGGAAQALGAIFDVIGSLLPVAGELLGSFATLGGPILAGVVAAIQPMIGMVSQLADWFGQLVAKIPPEVLTGIGAGFVVIAAGVKAYHLWTTLAATATRLWATAQAVFNAVMAANPIGIVIGVLAALGVAFVVAYRKSETFRDIVQGVWEAVKSAISTSVDAIMATIGWFAGLPGKISGWFGAAKDFAIRKFTELVNWVKGLPGRASSALSGLAGALRRRASEAGSQLVSATRQKISDAVNWVKGLPGRAKSALGNIGGVLWNAGKSLVTGFIDGIVSMFSNVKSTLGDLTSKLTSWKGPEELDKRILTPAGRSVIGGFMAGIDDLTPALQAQLMKLTRDLPSMTLEGKALPGMGGLPGGLAAGDTQQRVQVDVNLHVAGPEEVTRLIRNIVATKGGGNVQQTFGRGRG